MYRIEKAKEVEKVIRPAYEVVKELHAFSVLQSVLPKEERKSGKEIVEEIEKHVGGKLPKELNAMLNTIMYILYAKHDGMEIKSVPSEKQKFYTAYHDAEKEETIKYASYDDVDDAIEAVDSVPQKEGYDVTIIKEDPDEKFDLIVFGGKIAQFDTELKALSYMLAVGESEAYNNFKAFIERKKEKNEESRIQSTAE